jgi:hypothetical protein
MLRPKMKRITLVTSLSALLVVACVVRSKSGEPAPTPDAPPRGTVVVVSPPDAGPIGVPVTPAPPAKIVVGGSCTFAEECDSGICEGSGCGPGEGKCAAQSRPCTRDLRTYCGCDGKTFQASGSCPGQRFSAKNECAKPAEPAPVTKAADGRPCSVADDCASGICEGQGCGPGKGGKCVGRARICTMDAVTYCGCDGKEFTSSGSCPGQRYSAKGGCKK